MGNLFSEGAKQSQAKPPQKQQPTWTPNLDYFRNLEKFNRMLFEIGLTAAGAKTPVKAPAVKPGAKKEGPKTELTKKEMWRGLTPGMTTPSTSLLTEE